MLLVWDCKYHPKEILGEGRGEKKTPLLHRELSGPLAKRKMAFRE